MNTQETLADLLVTKYGVDRDKLAPEAAMADLGLDSLSLAELMFDIEDAFRIQVKAEGTDLKTLGDAIALIDRARADANDATGANDANDANDASG